QCFIGTGSRGLIDGVNDIDRRILGEEVFHGLTATLFIAGSDVVANDARICFVAPFVGIAEVNAETLEEALVAQHVDGGLADTEIEQRDLGIGGFGAKLASGPFAYQLASEEIVG